MSRTIQSSNRISRSWSKSFSMLDSIFPWKKRRAEPNPQSKAQPESGFKLHIGLLEDVEDREFYRVGGFHPTKIGDIFHGGRYEVVHKLGYGGFATVWFAQDRQTKSNVALKIVAADPSNDDKELGFFKLVLTPSSSSDELGRAHIPELLDNFWFDGPNGRHLCLVLPAFGPSIQQVMKMSRTRRLSGKTARSVALQATQALAFLHSKGLGHGDFRPANILFAIKGISLWSKEDAQHRLGDVIEEAVLLRDGAPVEDPGIPMTVIRPTDFTTLIPAYLEKFVFLVDFGETFHFNAPPANGLGTPASYCAPECHFDHSASAQTDIWALACTIFEIRAGYQLFQSFMGEYEDEVAQQVVTALGRLPEPWWGSWTFRDAFFDKDGKPVRDGMLERVTLADNLKEIGEDDPDGDSTDKTGGLLCQEEIDDLADLLGKMLRYEPSERIDIQTVLQHKWFIKEYKDNR